MAGYSEKYQGKLIRDNGGVCLLGSAGSRHFTSDLIWKGYIDHWLGMDLWGRYLPQRSYETGKPIVILWPDYPDSGEDYIDIYYNERLVKYPMSFLGHNAVNVNGAVFNFSVTLNENEVMTLEEYLYRPALGEFAPDPVTGKHSLDDPGKPYYDKFGRRFMRTVHVLRIGGLDTKIVTEIFMEELDKIKRTPIDHKKPVIYRDFNFFTRNCTTIIRDGLRMSGLKNIHGIFPRDFFINTACVLNAMGKNSNIRVRLFKLSQIKVDEAPYSAMSMSINPVNILRKRWFAKLEKA